MKIHWIIWPEDRMDHLARHAVTPEEFEEVCFGQPLVLRAQSEGENPVYYDNGSNKLGSVFDLRRHSVSGRQWIPGHGAPNDRQRKTSLQTMEKPMNTNKIPQTDSIQELARFWDTHDLTDFEEELEEVTGSVFERETVVKIHLPSKDAETVENLAKSQGLDRADLIREWVLEKVQASS